MAGLVHVSEVSDVISVLLQPTDQSVLMVEDIGVSASPDLKRTVVTDFKGTRVIRLVKAQPARLNIPVVPDVVRLPGGVDHGIENIRVARVVTHDEVH